MGLYDFSQIPISSVLNIGDFPQVKYYPFQSNSNQWQELAQLTKNDRCATVRGYQIGKETHIIFIRVTKLERVIILPRWYWSNITQRQPFHKMLSANIWSSNFSLFGNGCCNLTSRGKQEFCGEPKIFHWTLCFIFSNVEASWNIKFPSAIHSYNYPIIKLAARVGSSHFRWGNLSQLGNIYSVRAFIGVMSLNSIPIRVFQGGYYLCLSIAKCAREKRDLPHPYCANQKLWQC